jgi:hypothetical protein
MPGRRTKNVTNPQAHDAWMRRKKELRAENTQEIVRQGDWRIACLKARAAKGKLTKKNFAECKALGLMGTQYETLEA